MNKWQDYFEIHLKDDRDWFDDIDHWQLITKHDGKVVASYKDLKYAKKQAKYKFKQMMKKVESILLK